MDMLETKRKVPTFLWQVLPHIKKRKLVSFQKFSPLLQTCAHHTISYLVIALY